MKSCNIILGITGGIAAYKSPDLVRRLCEQGHAVRVVMTEAAKEFITPLTLQAVSGHPVYDDLLSAEAEAAMGHIELARWSDHILIAPATADCLARVAQGRANDLLTATCLASQAPLFIAPAMNKNMWAHQATQENIQTLLRRGITMIGPGKGEQACGDIGWGRMLEPTEIVAQLQATFVEQSLKDIEILLTAGPTREALDPLRYFTNRSSGKMGYALAEACRRLGAKVTLISGPCELTCHPEIDCLRVISADDMLDAVMSKVASADIFISTAAVVDYRPQRTFENKIKKSDGELQLTFVRNPDILQQVADLEKSPFLVGFAAETHDVLTCAKQKLIRKKLNMIVANQVSLSNGMAVDESAATILTADGREISLERQLKSLLAIEIMQQVAADFKH